MKYFSVKDWDEYDEKAEQVIAYRSYISSVRPHLPKDLQLLTGAGGELSLNDGEIESLAIYLETSTVRININGKWIEETLVGDRIYSLVYKGVISVISTIDPDAKGLHGSGYGFHGFDEVELIKENIFEHKMLFTSGIELQIRFQDFSMTYKDIPKAA